MKGNESTYKSAICRSYDRAMEHRRRRAKHQRRRFIVALFLVGCAAGLVNIATSCDYIATSCDQKEPQNQPHMFVDATVDTHEEVKPPRLEIVSKDEAIPEESEPDAPAPRYYLTEDERFLVESVVMAEAGCEPFEGQMLVAQCILNAAEKTGDAPSQIVIDYQYAPGHQTPSPNVRDAVAAVFDDGQVVTDEPILFFYAPALVTSEWHESQDFVIELGGHRFFAEKE